MATRIKVGDHWYSGENFSVTEEATPLAAGDSTGAVGNINVNLLNADPYLATGTGAFAALAKYGYGLLIDQDITIVDDEWGTTDGTISNASDGGNGLIAVTAISRQGVLNAYNVKAQPFVGTLGNLFRYYCSLAGIASGNVAVDSALNTRPIAAPGWIGELWYYLKQLAVAQSAEIAYVGGKYTLRQVRTRYAVQGYEIGKSKDTPLPTLAQSVEVYQYASYGITNQLVYPIGGWTPETEVLNVNAGEIAEYTLQLSASVSSIQAPTMMTSVPPTWNTSSVYTVVANDGLPVSPEMWSSRGGRLTVTINPDTTSLKVVIRGADRVPTSAGAAATNFSIALGSDTTGSRYSTLRIVGTGVAFDKTKIAVRTCVPPSKTSTEVGVTIDNIFLSSTDQVYRMGTVAAAQYAGASPTISSNVISVSGVRGQVFGTVNGTRVWDERTKRFYRIKSATLGPGAIDFQAEDDLTHGDVEEKYEGLTYAQVQARIGTMSYSTDRLTGLKDA